MLNLSNALHSHALHPLTHILTQLPTHPPTRTSTLLTKLGQQRTRPPLHSFAAAAVATIASASASATAPAAAALSPAVAISVSQKGMDYAITVAVPLLLSKLSSVAIPDVSFDQDEFEGALKGLCGGSEGRRGQIL